MQLGLQKKKKKVQDRCGVSNFACVCSKNGCQRALFTCVKYHVYATVSSRTEVNPSSLRRRGHVHCLMPLWVSTSCERSGCYSEASVHRKTLITDTLIAWCHGSVILCVSLDKRTNQQDDSWSSVRAMSDCDKVSAVSSTFTLKKTLLGSRLKVAIVQP